MPTITRPYVFATLTLAGLLAGACAGPATTIDQVWTSPSARADAPLRRVVTVFVTDNITLRHSGELDLARRLATTGLEATPGYVVFANGASDVSELDAMKVKLRELGYDGVITMRIVDREKNLESLPSSFDYYWGYWGPGYWSGGSEPYVYTETIYRIEAAAYSLSTGKLVWSVVTKTTDPDSTDELLEDTTEIIAGELRRRGLSG